MKTLSAPIFRLKRQAKALARETSIPLHQALDAIARNEGYQRWSQLAAREAARSPAQRLFERCVPGDLVLLGARPGHGKTTLGLELLVEAVRAGRRGYFFTLEYTRDDVWARLRRLGGSPASLGEALTIDTSDAISAASIGGRLRGDAAGAVAVVDYLQLLDQDRTKPPLATQLAALETLARERAAIIVCIAQIDRRFDPASTALPTLDDVRLPNPVDLARFSATCFLHDGKVEIQRRA